RGAQHQLLPERRADAPPVRVGPHRRSRGAHAAAAARAGHRGGGRSGDSAVHRHQAGRRADLAAALHGQSNQHRDLLERARVGDQIGHASLVRFLPRRCLQALPLLAAISALVFLLLHAAPGGPLAIYLSNPNVRPEDIERLRRALGLDRPLWEQYWSWLAAFARGDWGYSFS